MSLARLSIALSIAALLAMFALGIYDLVRWEMYRIEHGCVVVDVERNAHYPDRTTYECANGERITR